jgi:8-oxo-dGTP pyrophosphatase MutT (NUDIX family)
MTDKPWKILARRFVYDSDWIAMQQVDLRLPDGETLRDIHFVDYKHPAAGVVPIRDDGHILMIDHYRFQTDTRGWEIPAGKIDAGETAEQAAVRELREETGHRAASFKLIGKYHPTNGSSNQTFNIFIARPVLRSGEIEDTNEVMGLKWFSREDVKTMIARNEILDGLSLTGLCWAMVLGEI